MFTADEVAFGFATPYTIEALLRSGGTVGMLLLLFMAVTSTVSSSMIAVSSTISFDVYRTYINPKATDKQVVNVSDLGVVLYEVFITRLALMLNYGGANISWVNYFSPILTCPGIFPLIFTFKWSRQPKLAAIVSPILGLASGVSIWLAGAVPLRRCCVALLVDSVFTVISYLKPEHFDWREFLRIDLVEDETTLSTGSALSPDDSVAALSSGKDQKRPDKTILVPTVDKSPLVKYRRSRIGYTIDRPSTPS
ncbi:hypothetical protein MMC28_002593 [Mycoblastus sanguinarius]|nr:hypothetical protein [Mycoblastus sanguinarius]